MELNVNLKENSYKVILGNNILKDLSIYYSLDKKVLVLTDDLVPSSYSDEILKQAKKGTNISLNMVKKVRILITIF